MVITMQSYMGANNESVSNMNRALIIQYLKKNGICTRTEISRAVGLTGASITKIIALLIEVGIVSETEFNDGVKRSNRAIGISLNPSIYKVIAVKLSRRSFSVGVFDIGGTQYERVSRGINHGDSLKTVAQGIKSDIDGYLRQYSDVVSIGIAVPGPYNKRTGQLLLMTEMSNWHRIPFDNEFKDAFDVPVFIEHDANAGALAEWWFDNVSIVSGGTMVHFLVGEGVGAGVISKGNVLSGSNGIAGEIGHVSIDFHGERCECGNFGCLEKYCSSIAFVKRANMLLEKYKNSALHLQMPLTASKIFESARAGDLLARQLVDEVGTFIGYGVVMLVNAYDPSVIVISNEMAEGGEQLLTSVNRVARERLLTDIYDGLSIVISKFEHDPILYGAAAVATDKFLNKPLDFLDRRLNQ